MSNHVFDQRYSKLNTEQKLAVDSIEGPVMVVAGPGTGKTTILTLRIANILLKTDTPPSGILALTFTDVGVKAMRAKLREIIGSRADEVGIFTFHSFASSVIAEFGEYFPTIHRATQITPVLAESYIRDILKDKKFTKLRPLGDPDFYVGKILGSVSDSKKEAWTPEMVRTHTQEEIQRIKGDESSISTRGATKGQLKADALDHIKKCERTILFADVYSLYEEKKREHNTIDFDDLLFELLRALQENELLLRLLQEKFLYILVDEHQDTNDSQNMIVSLLANFFESPNVFVVGDEKQAIYRFQGASVENFLRFQHTWSDMKVISLKSNYRSHQRILDATHALIERNYAEGEHTNLRVRLDAHSKHNQKPIEYITAPNTDSADAVFVEHIQQIIRNHPESTTAVIVRRNRDVEQVLALCRAHGIDASAERGVDIFAHPIGRLYFNILEYIADPTHREALLETCIAGLWGMTWQTSIECVQKIKSSQSYSIEQDIPSLALFRDIQTRMGPIEYVIELARVSGLTELISRDPVSVEVWRGIVALATDLAHRSSIHDPRVLITELLAYRTSAETKSIKIGLGIVDAPVHIMTAHGSKGLEYDFVFLPYALEESWMRRHVSPPFILPREKDEDDDVRDIRRLFYVALTRARQHVVIISPKADSMGRELLPLRFIDELDQSHVIHEEAPLVEREYVKESTEDIKHRLQSEQYKTIHEYTKRRLVNNGLSVTALNHFCVCPSQFLYKSIFRLPEPPSGTSEKGIAMHGALSRVWKEEKRDVSTIQKTITTAVQEYFNASLLPYFEKEIILEELLEQSGVVASELVDYFAQDGRVLTESWVESEYSGMYAGKPVALKLHGQLDALIETDTDVSVYDYKTREAMSVNAIKGDTQDSDGNYFRQLVFYYMLLRSQNRYAKKPIHPSLIFVKPTSKGRCPTITLPIEEGDISRVEGEIGKLIESVWSGSFLTDTCEDPECEWCKRKRLFLVN